MKRLGLLCLAFISFSLVSCNQDKIDELEYENEELKDEISDLKNRISELEEINQKQEVTIENFGYRLNSIKSHVNNAQSVLHNLKFWRTDEFFFSSYVNQLADELNSAMMQSSGY